MSDQVPRLADQSPDQPLTDEQLAAFAEMARNPPRLSDEEEAEHDRCVQSVIDARRYAEQHAHEWWIG